MNTEPQITPQVPEQGGLRQQLHTVTPLSKYLAMALFIIMPFVGGWIGYQFAPVHFVEVEKVVIKEVEVEKIVEVPAQQSVYDASNLEGYVSPNGFSISLPSGVRTEELPAQSSFSPVTRVEGDFGSLCISSGYGCGGVGMQGWTRSGKTLTTSDGVKMDFVVWSRDDEVFLSLDSFANTIPEGFSEDAQIQLRTTVSQLEISELILSSISFMDSR